MNGEHSAHLDRITKWVVSRLMHKYAEGQRSHGGELWRKAGMVAHAEMELLDLITYVHTMREQLETVLELMEAAEYRTAEDGLRAVLELDPKD